MKEQDKVSEKGLNGTERDNLLDKEFKIRVIKKLTRLERRVDELRI